MAFSFVAGRAEVLGIPSELVSVSLESVLTALTALLAFLGLCSLMIDMMMSSAPEWLLESSLFRLTTPIIALAIFAGLGGLLVYHLVYLLEVIPALYLSTMLIAPFYNRNNGGTYFERLKEYAEAAQKLRRNPERRTWLLKRVGVGPIWVVGTVMALIVVSAVMGRGAAWWQTHYFVSLTQPREVLLARYGDVLVFRRGNSPTVMIRVIGKDQIPQLAKVLTGSMAIAANP